MAPNGLEVECNDEAIDGYRYQTRERTGACAQRAVDNRRAA